MRGIRLTDKAAQVLSFDLREVLQVIGNPPNLRDEWKVRFIDFTVGYDADRLNRIHRFSPDKGGIGQFSIKQRVLTRRELDELAGEIHQTMNCEIVAYKSTPRGKRIILVIKAHDTSWWDVLTADSEILVNFKTRFRQVKEITDDYGRSRADN